MVLAVGESSYIFLDINDRLEGNYCFAGRFFKLALTGNEGFVGHTIDMSSLRGNMTYYREFGLGFSKNFSDRLRIGVKGKLLFGVATASLDNNAMGITVNDDYSHTLDADLLFNISAPVGFIQAHENIVDSIIFDDNKIDAGFFMGKKNVGLGLDIGATYELTDQYYPFGINH